MPKDALQDAISEFVAKVRAITRQEAVEAMQAAFGVDAAPVRKGGRPPVARAARRRRKGGKRDPQVLAALVTKLAAEIKAKPGKRVEEIGRGLRVPTKELALPIK